jgi:hypothetical protein
MGGLKKRIATHYGIEVSEIAVIFNGVRYETAKMRTSTNYARENQVSKSQSKLVVGKNLHVPKFKKGKLMNQPVSRTPSPRTAKQKLRP